MKVTHIALLSVVFLDVMSQGLVIPILNTVIMDPSQGFLPSTATVATRQFDFGLTMGVFFLAWFFGAAYISKLSDFFGRKQGILICLFGNLLGYALTIVSLELNSFALMLLARAITGFTAGNQPIAQAALVDLSSNDQQKTRYLGLVLVALSFGLMVGPLMSGLLSDKALLGDFASLELSFYCVSVLVIINIILIIFFFHDERTERRPFKFQPLEVFLTLWYAFKRPVILKLSLVFFWAQLALNSFYIFMDNYYYSRFQFDTLQNSIALVVLGGAMALASAFLVTPIAKRFSRMKIICACMAIMGVSAVLSLVNTSPLIAYLLIVVYIVPFAIYYPTVVTLFSLAVDDSEQGWVMGVTIALYTLGAGLVSVIGGQLMAINIQFPFFISAGSAALGLLLVFFLWRGEDMRALLEK